MIRSLFNCKTVSYPQINFILFFIIVCSQLNAQIVLLGDNSPHANINDGDFRAVWDYWRNASQSPFWTTKIIKGNQPMGLHYGSLFSMNELGVAESKLLNTNPDYQNLQAGDVLDWSFGADLEYISKGTISISLVFGEQERMLADKVILVGSDKIIEHFKGNYTLLEEDVKAGFPFVRATFYSEDDVKVYLHYVNISVRAPEKTGPELNVRPKKEGIQLNWHDDKTNENSIFYVYRRHGEESDYLKIKETKNDSYLDTSLINGIRYTYLVTRFNDTESGASNSQVVARNDRRPPVPPTKIETQIFDTEVKLIWTKSQDKDVANYSIYRGDAKGNNMKEIASNINENWYEDVSPPKDIENTYVLYAHDYSGNKSIASESVKAKVKATFGSSFRDLILPMPIHKKLTSDTWGAENVVPRDIDNGIEDPEWSYWGGTPVKDKDGKYHMQITRWPANATKGHWEWPNSTVAHVISEKPTGPYLLKNKIAYSYSNGKGHNPDIVRMNDGTYMLYSLIDWEATLFTSGSMNGPWNRLGTMTVNWEEANPEDKRDYQYYRNLSGVQLDDGSFLFVTKFGCMIKSETDPLGPYTVLTKTIHQNQTIPERYRKSNYEDPVMWKDEVQFHMLINGFIDKRAIYLRSPDGVNWKFDPGVAYDPKITSYENGHKTHWNKLERPHVLQDEYGRATHLSLAVMDVPKADDLAGDNHNSKNLIIPLTVHKRIVMLNKKKVDASTKTIQIMIRSEQGFDAQKDVDIHSLLFGASEEVNFGRGFKAIKTRNKGKDLIVEFDGTANEITNDNFVGKLLGKTVSGDLLIGFCKLKTK